MTRPPLFVCATLVSLLIAGCQGNQRSSEPGPAAPATAAPRGSTVPAKTAPRPRTPAEVVEELGRRMKLVPTTAAREIAAAAIREQYTSLVDPQLLDEWVADPGKAPGRPVSSPWPERLEVQSSSRSSGDVLVKAVLVEATSTGSAARVPVDLRLENANGEWRISSYKAERAAPADSKGDAEVAAQVVRDYYRAIDAKDFDRAYAFWGPAGPPGQTREEFARGFVRTESVSVTTGQPSRVEPAAGSRYITVPVTIATRTTSGARQRFEGSYVLRRSVVDGATEAQRTWHLERASIRQVTRNDAN